MSFWTKYGRWLWSNAVDRETLTGKSKFFTEDAEAEERLNQEPLNRKGCTGSTCACYHSHLTRDASSTSP